MHVPFFQFAARDEDKVARGQYKQFQPRKKSEKIDGVENALSEKGWIITVGFELEQPEYSWSLGKGRISPFKSKIMSDD